MHVPRERLFSAVLPTAVPIISARLNPTPGFFQRLLARRHGGLVLFFAAFVGISFLTRVALLVKAAQDVSWTLSLLAAFGWGLLYDLGAACFAGLPLIALLTVLPSGALRRAWVRWLAAGIGFAILFGLLFGAAAEWTFWDEFGVRFNFIAVDYLVYTTEVMGNIRESYPMPLIICGLFTAAAVFGWLLWRSRLPHKWRDGAVEHWPRRYRNGALWFAGTLAVGLAVNADWLPGFKNNFNRELAKNGLWSLFSAFRNNVLDYDEFYPTKPVDQVFARLRQELTEDGAVMLRPDEPDTLRYIKNPGSELRPNVVQITVESLSADFLGIFNRASNLTPNLVAIAEKSLVFENFYATGTRTDRGMEALTLSLPPTPGRSMIKRPRNEDLFTLGSVFRAKGYDTAFIYGGFGYFDNMNHYFGHNGYRVIDRAGVPPEDITFANVWGACDEDLLRWTLREADASAAAGRPFHYFVMTTSNHRPYTFPEGRIDLPSKVSGRAGAVKYTDYAIGKFLRDAAEKPWFKATVFVIVADHCASSAGRTELPVENYHIPLLIYAPGGHIAPGRIKTLTSQMDYAPTLLGLLNWSYPSRFFGHDVRKINPAEAHALIGNYQKLGHIEKGEFVILRPRGGSTYKYEFGANTMTPVADNAYGTLEAISYYQGASYLYKHNLYRALSAEEFTHYSLLGEEKATERKAVVSHP
ncbi:MAG: sulfatase-like hydrolase/transferase [Opitutae bacterium]|nr:sulfatase-like hydrolase/transferase [Opitutae bacterium]